MRSTTPWSPGEAAIGAYYAGDYFTMLDAEADDVDLRFYYPDPTNYFIDAMCIPSCCENKELAEVFINFMLSQETAVANAEYIYYASPNSLVYNDETYQEDMGEEAPWRFCIPKASTSPRSTTSSPTATSTTRC